MNIHERPRRLRRTEGMRRLVRQVHLDPANLILPVFVREGAKEPIAIGSMPGVVQHTQSSLKAAVNEAAKAAK